MLSTLLGKKIGMSQLWDESGNCHAVTVIQAGPCTVVQVKSKDGKDGYDAVQLGFEELQNRNEGKGDPRGTKPLVGHFKRHGVQPHRRLGEVRLGEGEAAPEAGSVVTVEVFNDVKKVDVSGTSKGRGFAGCIKRHNFQRGPKTHGSKNYREPGSTGAGTTPARVIPGKRMPGHMGAKKRTVRNLKVVKVENEHNLIYVGGAVPGPNGGYVVVRKAVRG